MDDVDSNAANINSFIDSLIYEIEKAIDESGKLGLKPTFRLNAYSDIRWEKESNIFDIFSEVTFYDYTKLNNRTTPNNYQLTYSHYGNFETTSKGITWSNSVAFSPQ